MGAGRVGRAGLGGTAVGGMSVLERCAGSDRLLAAQGVDPVTELTECPWCRAMVKVCPTTGRGTLSVRIYAHPARWATGVSRQKDRPTGETPAVLAAAPGDNSKKYSEC